MSRIGPVFSRKGRVALMPYVTVGYPSIEATLEVVPLLAENGCDIVELGIPFSDPLADGATIQKASFQALKNGVTTRACLEVAGKLSKMVDIPLVFMTYFNPVLSHGLEQFCSDCRQSGVDGLIIPDLLPEEGSELEAVTLKNGLDLIYLLAPTSNRRRIGLVAQKTRGFIYLVSVAGVTGARDSLPEDLERSVARVRSVTSQPLCVGFGISTAAQAAQVARIADGVIVGSRIVQLMEAGDSAALRAFIADLRTAIDRARCGS